MQVELEEVSPVLARLKVVVPSETVQQESQKVLAAYGKKARIAGFRPGKAPLSVVERRYGKEIQDELLDKVIPDYCFKAIKEKGVVLVQNPRIADVDYSKGENLSFTALVERRPRFELKPYIGMKVTRNKVTVTDEDVALTLEGLQERTATVEEAGADYAVRMGDIAVIDCHGTVGGIPFQGGEIKDYEVRVGRFNIVKGFDDKLVGAGAGDKLEISGTLPDNLPDAAISGKECLFSVEIKKVSKVILPELNDEFVKAFGKEETLDAFKEKILEDIRLGKERDADLKVKFQVMKAVTSQYDFEVPASMAEQELLRIIQRNEPYRDWQKKPLTDGEFIAYQKEKGREAVENVRGRIVLEDIAIKEKINCSEADVERELSAIAAASGESPDSVKKYYIEKYGSMDAYRGILTLDKIVSFLVDEAVVEEVEA